MSEVPKRQRNLSGFAFYDYAKAIYVEVSRLATSQRIVPKSYRFTHAQPLVELAHSLLHNVTRSDAFYPNTAHNVMMRRHYLTLAIADCEQLAIDFGLLPDIGIPVNVNNFEKVTDLIEAEIGCLKGARSGVRRVGRRSREQELADVAEQIAELQRYARELDGI